MDLDNGEDAAYGETLKVMDISLGRAPEPQSNNEEVCIAYPAPEKMLHVHQLTVCISDLHDGNSQFPLP